VSLLRSLSLPLKKHRIRKGKSVSQIDRNDKDDKTDRGAESGVSVLEKTKLQEPPLYKVLMFNDDYTPMEFVVHVLKSIFRKSETDALQIMLDIHHKGFAVVGIFTFEVAETKTYQVNEIAKKHEYPLLTKFERE
jgi:ATP-dependent Clp protease adaptor protein ClpS